jgi:hypothetical protein
VDRFIDHLQVVSTNNYNTVADCNTTNHPTLSSQSVLLILLGNSTQQWLFLCNVFTRRFLVKNLSNGEFSASVARWLTLHNRTLNWTVQPVAFKITPRHGPRRVHRLSTVEEACLPRRCIATVSAWTLIENTALLSLRFRFRRTVLTSRCLETGYITPLLYCWMRVCCGPYIATAAVYRVAV